MTFYDCLVPFVKKNFVLIPSFESTFKFCFVLNDRLLSSCGVFVTFYFLNVFCRRSFFQFFFCQRKKEPVESTFNFFSVLNDRLLSSCGVFVTFYFVLIFVNVHVLFLDIFLKNCLDTCNNPAM